MQIPMAYGRQQTESNVCPVCDADFGILTLPGAPKFFMFLHQEYLHHSRGSLGSYKPANEYQKGTESGKAVPLQPSFDVQSNPDVRKPYFRWSRIPRRGFYFWHSFGEQGFRKRSFFYPIENVEHFSSRNTTVSSFKRTNGIQMVRSRLRSRSPNSDAVSNPVSSTSRKRKEKKEHHKGRIRHSVSRSSQSDHSCHDNSVSSEKRHNSRQNSESDLHSRHQGKKKSHKDGKKRRKKKKRHRSISDSSSSKNKEKKNCNLTEEVSRKREKRKSESQKSEDQDKDGNYFKLETSASASTLGEAEMELCNISSEEIEWDPEPTEIIPVNKFVPVSPPSPEKKSSVESYTRSPAKCLEFPNCSGITCSYSHPTCPVEQVCTDDSCLFDHKSRPNASTNCDSNVALKASTPVNFIRCSHVKQVMCRRCRRGCMCPFIHGNCIDGLSCTEYGNKQCLFEHPDEVFFCEDCLKLAIEWKKMKD